MNKIIITLVALVLLQGVAWGHDNRPIYLTESEYRALGIVQKNNIWQEERFDKEIERLKTQGKVLCIEVINLQSEIRMLKAEIVELDEVVYRESVNDD